MNQEAQFGLRFVVKDLAKMRKAMETVNKNLEKMQKTAGNATKNVDKVNTSLGKATRSALKFAAAYFTVTRVINSINTRAAEAIEANTASIISGVQEKAIGKLGKALKQFGGDARSAGTAYSNLTNVIGGAKHGLGISEDIQRVNAMFGIGFNYGNISQDQLMTEIAKAMHRLKGNNDAWGINQIASAYGLTNDVTALLSTYGAGWRSKVSKEQWSKMNLTEAQRTIKAQEDLRDALNKFMDKLAPMLTDVTNALTKLTDVLKFVVGPLMYAYDFFVNGPDRIGKKLAEWFNKRKKKEDEENPINPNILETPEISYTSSAVKEPDFMESFIKQGVTTPQPTTIKVENTNGKQEQPKVEIEIIDKTAGGIKAKNNMYPIYAQ